MRPLYADFNYAKLGIKLKRTKKIFETESWILKVYLQPKYLQRNNIEKHQIK